LTYITRRNIMTRNIGKRIFIIALSAMLALAGAPMAGSFAADGDVIAVSTGEELDLALREAPEGALILLEADIDAVASATYGSSSYGTGTVKKLTIDGQGHTINGNGISTGTPPAGTTPRNDISNGTALRFASSTANTNLVFKNITFKNLASSLSFGGGAIGVYHGTVTIRNCTFLGNESLSSGGDGGAVLVDGSGGDFTIVNSTFYGNSSLNDGGAIASSANGNIINITAVSNTAGRQGGALVNNNANNQVALANSILIGNKVVTTGDEPATTDNDVAALSKDGGNNLLGVATEATIPGRGTNPATVLPVALVDSTVTGVTLEAAAAWLAPAPADNGGLTPTIALLEGAPAIDSAGDSAPKTDQRNLLRVGQGDIGAYEYGASIEPASTNAAILTADQPTSTTQNKIGFTLAAQFAEADAVNAVELVFSYDKSVFNAVPTVVAKDLEVASTFVNTDKGLVSVVLGVVNDKIINFDIPLELARVTLTVKEGLKPDKATLKLESFKVYSRGGARASEIISDTAETAISILNTEPNDVNLDGVVDTADLSLALYYFGALSSDEDWGVTGAADIDGDGDVDMADITILVNAIHAAA
jgi:hypothetical protein